MSGPIAPIRSSEEISDIITRGQHTIADLGLEIVQAEKIGTSSTDKDLRDKIYRLILLCAYFDNLLNDDLELTEFYDDPDNEVILNKVLDGIVRLSRIYDGAAIPLLGRINLPIILSSLEINDNNMEGFTRFNNPDVDSPNEVCDQFNVTEWNEFAVWIYSVRGSGVGEGSRSGIITAVGRDGGTPDWSEQITSNVGGSTSDLTFSVVLSGSTIQLLATAATNNWNVRGVRII